MTVAGQLSKIAQAMKDARQIDFGNDRELIRTAEGGIRACLANAILILSGDTDAAPEARPWAGAIGFDEFANQVFSRTKLPWDRPDRPFPRTWEGVDDTYAAEWLQHRQCMVNPKVTAQAVEAVARRSMFHPVREFLESLEWDGIERLDFWLTDHLGVEDSDYSRAVAARWMISAVARIFEPGCKADNVLILEGPQGALKSTALRTLGAPWFTDEMADLTTKDASLQTRGVWLIELSELDSLARAEVAKIKAFISRRVDRFRPPYGERLIDSPRQCVFAGTTNQTSGYLRDETGGRRFWPVKVGEIKIPALEEARAQLWAEAVQRYRSRERWWLDSTELNHAAAEAQSERFEGDAWEGLVSNYLRGRSQTSVAEVLTDVVQMPRDRWSRTDQMRVGSILTMLGWQRQQKRIGSAREWVYIAPPSWAGWSPPSRSGDE